MNQRTHVPSVLFLTLALLLSSPVTSASEDDLDKPISLNLKDADLRMVFSLYGEILGVELQLDPAVGGPISFSFDDISVRTSLNAICESAKCRWQYLDGDPVVLRIDPGDYQTDPTRTGLETEGPRIDVSGARGMLEVEYRLDSPVSLNLVEADATTVLETAAKIIGARLLLDRDLKGSTVTVNADGVPLSTILDTTCDDLGCTWELIEGNPPTLAVRYP